MQYDPAQCHYRDGAQRRSRDNATSKDSDDRRTQYMPYSAAQDTSLMGRAVGRCPVHRSFNLTRRGAEVRCKAQLTSNKFVDRYPLNTLCAAAAAASLDLRRVPVQCESQPGYSMRSA